jgi:hypothetical protein
MCDVTRRSRELLTGVNLWMLNILLSLNQWVYPLWELQMTTKHGGHLPGSNGVKENNSEHGAKDDCWFPDILMLQRLKRSRSS